VNVPDIERLLVSIFMISAVVEDGSAGLKLRGWDEQREKKDDGR
jgi:hypothetical protein